MNVQKISKFIFTCAVVFCFFGLSNISFAWGGGEVVSSFSGSDIILSCSSSFGDIGTSTGFYTYFGDSDTPLEELDNTGTVTGSDNDWLDYWCASYFPSNWDISPYVSGSGDYILAWKINKSDIGFSDFYYVVFNWDGSQITSVNIPYIPPIPHIDTFSYSTTTAQVIITGYWEATTTPYLTQKITFFQYSDALGEESREQITATTTGTFSFTFDFNSPYAWGTDNSSTTPIFSQFELHASLDQYDETNYTFPYGGTVVTNLDATSTVLTADLYNASDFTLTPRDLAAYPEYECDITHIMGCIKNALIWTFYPTQDALDNWNTLRQKLENKAPIGYFYTVKNSINGLSATSTAAFSVTIPAHLKQYIFDPFDIGIAGILWFFFIFHFYKRLKNIDI